MTHKEMLEFQPNILSISILETLSILGLKMLKLNVY